MVTEDNGAAMSANWDALTNDTVVVQEAPSEVADNSLTAAMATETIIVEGDKPAEVKPTEAAPATEEKKEAAPAAATEEKKPEVPEELSLSVDDIKDAPKTFEENSFQAFGQELKLEVKENTFAAFKEAIAANYVPKEEFEQATSATKEAVLTQFSPEVAAAIKLKDMGIADEYIFNPTAQHDYLLNLDSATLLRMKLENTPGYDSDDLINAQIEEWITDGVLDTKARLEKINLSNERKQILETKSKLVQQYTEEKQLAEERSKQEQSQKFMDALTKESSFFGLPVSKEVKDVISAKFQKGGYDNVLNNPQSMVKAVLYAEFGEKMSKIALAKAESKGRAEVTERLSNIPQQKGAGGGRVISQQEPGQTSNWDALL